MGIGIANNEKFALGMEKLFKLCMLHNGIIFYQGSDMLLPDIMDLRITSKCNLNCQFCYGTKCKEELLIDQWEELLDRFWTFGVRKLVISGGEPTLYSDICRLIKHAKSLGYIITLSTNGTLYSNLHLDDILVNLDWISLPIDGTTFEAYRRMRNLNIELYNNIFKLMKYVATHFDTKIKIGTVISRKNIGDLDGILNQISNYADKWKLYQVYLYGKPKEIINSYYISNTDYKKKYQMLLNKAKDKDINLVSYENSSMNGKYLFCEPDGSAMTIVQYKEHIFGSFIFDFYESLRMWKKYINEELLVENYSSTYF